MARDGLEPRQERFVQEYVVDLNGTQAAIRAGYSPDSAREQASRLLTNVAVQAAIKEEKEKYARLVQIEAYRVLRELVLIAHSDVTKFVVDEATGAVTAGPELPAEATRAISSVERKAVPLGNGKVKYQVKIRLWSKTEALKLLGQYLDLFDKGGEGPQGPPYKVYLGFDPREALCQPQTQPQTTPPTLPPPADPTPPGGAPSG